MSAPIPIRIVVRADADRAIGTGHFARSAAVADALSIGAETEVVLVTSQKSATLVQAYFPASTLVIALAADDADPVGTIRELTARGYAPDVVFLDQYERVGAWEAQAAKDTFPLLVMDDLDAARTADVIVRAHGGRSEHAPSTVLRGPAYLPLSRKIADLAARKLQPRNARPKVNVCFGGSDPTGETSKAIRALATVDQVDADVVIGPSASIDDALFEQASRLPHIALHVAPSQEALANLLTNADFALGAGGVMLWERLCLGIPSLVVATADNQRRQIALMAEAGVIRFLGDHGEVTSEGMTRAVHQFVGDVQGRQAMMATARKMVDGRGAIRIAACLRSLALEARQVAEEDAENLFHWRTHPDNTRYDWGTSAKPAFSNHMIWVQARIEDPACVFYIISLKDHPVGVARFDMTNEGRLAYLSIYLVPGWHGRKMGLPVYLAAVRALLRSRRDVERIVSRVHTGNLASVRLHLDAGFDLAPSKEHPDWLDAQMLLGQV